MPVAISAFTSAKRDLIGIESVVDQTNYTPGLTYTAGNDRLSLRGVGRLTNVHAADSGTAIYTDGVFLDLRHAGWPLAPVHRAHRNPARARRAPSTAATPSAAPST